MEFIRLEEVQRRATELVHGLNKVSSYVTYHMRLHLPCRWVFRTGSDRGL